MQEMAVKRANSLECTIDWLSFTIFSVNTVEDALRIFGFRMTDFFEAPRGAMGYKKMLIANDSTIRVLSDGNDDMGIHIDVSGSSMAVLYEAFKSTLLQDGPFGAGVEVQDFNSDLGKYILVQLLEKILEVGQISRMDIAIDDYKPYFTLSQLDRIVQKRLYTSYWRTNRSVIERSTEAGITGYTVYMGRRDGDIMLRVYDKELEQKKQQEDYTGGAWVRWELEMKDLYANNAASKLIYGVKALHQNKDDWIDLSIGDLVVGISKNDLYANNSVSKLVYDTKITDRIDITVGDLVMGILKKYLRIIVLDDSNRSRCSTDKRWLAFLGECEKLRLYIPKDESDIKQKKNWVMRQVAPTLSGIILADFDEIIASYGDMEKLAEYVLLQSSRMSPELVKQIQRVNPHWREDLDRLLDEIDEKRRYLYE